MCAARPNGLLPFKVFALYGSEDRIQAFSTKNGLVFGLGWSFGERQPLVADEEASSQEAARAERGTRAKSLRAEAQTGSSCHVAIASSLWKRRAYPVEISAEQNFGEGQPLHF